MRRVERWKARTAKRGRASRLAAIRASPRRDEKGMRAAARPVAGMRTVPKKIVMKPERTPATKMRSSSAREACFQMAR